MGRFIGDRKRAEGRGFEAGQSGGGMEDFWGGPPRGQREPDGEMTAWRRRGGTRSRGDWA